MDATGPSFVISRESYGYRLDQVHWDTIRDIGLFSSLADAMSAVRQRLSIESARAPTGRPTLH